MSRPMTYIISNKGAVMKKLMLALLLVSACYGGIVRYYPCDNGQFYSVLGSGPKEDWTVNAITSPDTNRKMELNKALHLSVGVSSGKDLWNDGKNVDTFSVVMWRKYDNVQSSSYVSVYGKMGHNPFSLGLRKTADGWVYEMKGKDNHGNEMITQTVGYRVINSGSWMRISFSVVGNQIIFNQRSMVDKNGNFTLLEGRKWGWNSYDSDTSMSAQIFGSSGSIDEVYILDNALTSAQMDSLLDYGKYNVTGIVQPVVSKKAESKYLYNVDLLGRMVNKSLLKVNESAVQIYLK
jgi:hypothetical protein